VSLNIVEIVFIFFFFIVQLAVRGRKISSSTTTSGLSSVSACRMPVWRPRTRTLVPLSAALGESLFRSLTLPL
jgi:hypothetical protein